MRVTNKPSHTGLMNQQHEVHRLENLFYTQEGAAHYLPGWGIDWSVFSSPNMEIPTGAFLSYMNQQAFAQGIAILEVARLPSQFELSLRVKLLSEELTLVR